MKIKLPLSERIFHIINTIIMVLMIVIMVYPFLHVLFASFSNPAKLMAHRGLLLHPLDATVAAYQQVMKNPMLLRSYVNTIIIVVAGVAINLLLTAIGAYFLSRRNVMFKKPVMVMIVITMYFSGGIIPMYFTVQQLGLMDSLWSLILPSAVNTFNLIIMRTSFASIPAELEEAATVDGAGHFTMLFRIIMPVSMAVVAVVTLYYAVGHWNSWFNAMIYLTDRQKFPLQLILREILIQNDTSTMTVNVDIGEQSLVGDTIKYAIIIVATVPILCIYPFLQKYFVKGVMIGSLKG